MKLIFAMSDERQQARKIINNYKPQFLKHLAKILEEGENSIYFLHHIKEINNNFLKPIVSMRSKLWNSIDSSNELYLLLLNNNDVEKIVTKLAEKTKNKKYNDYKGWLLIKDLASSLSNLLWKTKKVPNNDWWRQQLYFYFEYVGV